MLRAEGVAPGTRPGAHSLRQYQQAGSLLAGGGEPSIDIRPIDDVPECLHVVGAHVRVVEVVGVLPDVEQQHGYRARGEVRLLIEELLHDELLAQGIPDECRPP